MLDLNMVLILGMGMFIVAIVAGQQKFKNKMLCTFRRPNKQKIERWVPLYSKYIIFDRGKYGTGRYSCNPKCITLEWYDRGINKLFPVLIPTLDFVWWSEEPLNPETFEIDHRSPEASHAALQEDNFLSFTKAAQKSSGAKSRFPEWMFPAITIVAIVAIGYLVYQLMGQVAALENWIKIKG